MPALTGDELQTLLSGGESDRVERKRNASDLDRIREAVCAFANDLPDRRQPGVVFIGIEDNGACSNLPITDDLLRLLGSIRDDGALMPFPTIEVRRAIVSGCPVTVVIVQPSTNPPIRCRGRAWIRVGPRRGIASPDDERRLVEKRRWGNLPFDAQPVIGSTLADIDIGRFKLEYLPALVSADTIAQNQRTDTDQMRALRLVDLDDVPSFTAIVMLGKSPQNWFPGAVIAWRRVAGNELTAPTVDERTLTGIIPDQLRRVDDVMSAANASAIAMGRQHIAGRLTTRWKHSNNSSATR